MCKKGNLLRAQGAMILGNFDSWIRSPRTILMLLFTVTASFLTVRSYGIGLRANGFTMTATESLAFLLLTGFGKQFLASVTFLVMVSELPRRIPFQQYTLIRASRTRWISAQLLYCFLMVVFMIVFMTLVFALFLLPVSSPGSGWSDTQRIAQGLEPELAYVPEWIRTNFSPIQALMIAIVPIFLFWFTMVLIILFFSLLGAPIIGLVLYSTILFSSVIVLFEDLPGFFMPMQYSTLLKMVYGYEDQFQARLLTVFGVYAALIGMLMAGIFVAAKHAELPTYAQNKN